MELRGTRVVLRCRDFDQACRFYGGTMGLPRVREWDTEDGRSAVFHLGEAFLEVLGRPRGARGRDERFDYQGPSQKVSLVLVVPSAQKAYEEMFFHDRNVPGGLRHDTEGTLVFETHDPDGVKILLYESAV